MRIPALLLLLICPVILVQSQTSLKKLDLKYGDYPVGFRHYRSIDSTRTYGVHNEFNNKKVFRPIPISIWYPSKLNQEQAMPLSILDYLQILKEEEEWENLPNEFLLDWFPYLWNTPENRSHLVEKTITFPNSILLQGKFPVIVYAPSYQASSIENFALFEYLASHGFVVISSPSRGTDSRWLEGGTAKDIETQSRDVEYLLKEIHRYPNVDSARVALMGFSFGGLSNMITAMKNPRTKVLISLDGTERYRYDVLQKSVHFDLAKLKIPYVHFAQKEIPEIVLKEDKIPEELNHTFRLYDSLKYSKIHRYKFHHLSHSYFSSFGVLFANRDKRQDETDANIMVSYKNLSEHVLQFLNGTLKNEEAAIQFMENTPVKNGFPEKLISKRTKEPIEVPFTYKDFNDMAINQGYKDLIPLYERILVKFPDMELKEGMLNTLGLKLAFDPEHIEKGINVFLLALHIYPKSANLYDSLGEAYLYKKEYKNAIISFEKSLELNPKNQNAIKKLNVLRK